MIIVLGMIMAICPFMAPIMPSMALGSVMGFGGAWPRFSGLLRYAPDSYAAVSTSRRASNDRRESAWKFCRTLMPCTRLRCSRWARCSRALGTFAKRTVA